MISKIFLLGAPETDQDITSAPALEIMSEEFTTGSKKPENMPEEAFVNLKSLVSLVEAVEKYVGVAATYRYVLGVFPQYLVVSDPIRMDGGDEDVQLSVDSSMLLAALLLTCAPCMNVECQFIPTENLDVVDNLIDTKTGAQVSEVRLTQDAGDVDCTRAIYLIKRDLGRFAVDVLGSFNIESGKFEDFDGKSIPVDSKVAEFAARKDWMRD